jgi:hypothetical protein
VLRSSPTHGALLLGVAFVLLLGVVGFSTFGRGGALAKAVQDGRRVKRLVLNMHSEPVSVEWLGVSAPRPWMAQAR